MSATDKERLKQVLAAYGAEPSRWPVEERAALERQLAATGSDDLPDLSEAREVDFLLSSLQEKPIPDTALQTVLALSEQNPKAQVVPIGAEDKAPVPWLNRQRLREAFPIGIALAASLLAGVFAGLDEQFGNFATVASLETPAPGLEDALWSFDPFNMGGGEQL